VPSSDKKAEKIVAYYSDSDEQSRLSASFGQLEFIRSQNIIGRYLVAPPAVVLDVGGAAGMYSCWLAKEGYQVHLVDIVPLHIEQAKQASQSQPETPISSFTVGDARQLEFDDEIADAVLLLGPLYHLVEEEDRLQALGEAFRVLKAGGYLFAAGISQFASTIDGLISGACFDPVFQTIMINDLESGQHRNPTNHPKYFMDTFFHHPEELRAEVGRAGFEVVDLLAIEGISYMLEDFGKNWESDEKREFLLEIIGKTEKEISLIGASPHIMCVGMKE
jgi:ubiquinone/menaquinone biosynthesis C-methylase UbiE